MKKQRLTDRERSAMWHARKRAEKAGAPFDREAALIDYRGRQAFGSVHNPNYRPDDSKGDKQR